MAPVDPIRVRDMARLASTHPFLVARLIPILDHYGLFVVEGSRSAGQQHDKWCQGRNPVTGQIVDRAHVITYCDGVQTRSNHQPHADGYGHAVDIAFRGPVPFPPNTDPRWTVVGEAAEAAGLVWGGRFRAPVDLDHIELADNPAATAAHLATV